MLYPRSRGDGRRNANLAAAAAVIGLFGLAALMGLGRLPRLGVSLSPVLIVGVVVAGAVLVVTLGRIEYGIVTLPVAAAAAPFAIGTGTASVLVAALLFAGYLLIAWIARMLILRRLILRGSPVTVPLVGFALVSVLSTVFSTATQDPLVFFPASWSRIQAGGVSVFVISAATLLLAANNLRDERWVRRLTWVFLSLGAIAIAGYYLQSQQDVSGFAVGGVFSLWVVALALGQVLYNRGLPWWWRAGLLALAVGWFYRRFALEPDWLSGWVPLCVAVLTLALLRSRRLFSVMIVGALVAGALNYEAIFATQVEGAESQGNFFRLELWQQNYTVVRDHLLLGLGAAGYAPYYAALFPSTSLSTHNNYLDVFAQTGLIGSFLFLWFLVATWRVAARARRRWPAGFAAGFVNGAAAGIARVLVALAHGDWVIPFVYNQTIAGFRYTVHTWLLLGALVAMLHIPLEAGPLEDLEDLGDAP
jgi:hypothetical protein